MFARDPRLLLLGLGLLVATGLFLVRDAPAQLRQVRFERQRLAGLDTEQRRVEMYFPPPDRPDRLQHYVGMRRYFEFMQKVRDATPEDARIGLAGLPMESLYKFAHYYLYPRHPFAVDGRDSNRATTTLRLDYLATFDDRGGRVRRAR